MYGFDTAVTQDNHTVGLSSELWVMGDDDEGLPQLVTQVEEELVKALLIGCIETPRRFVGEDDRRGVDEGASDSDTLALPTSFSLSSPLWRT